MLLWGGGPLDRQIYEAVYAGHRPALSLLRASSPSLGEPTVLIGAGIVCAALAVARGSPPSPMVLLAIVAIGRALSEAQKYWIARARPDLEPHLVAVKTSSFPSGHATSSMIFYLTLALVLTAGTRWHRVAAGGAILLSLLIGASRVMLGVHWPSDVIGGWAFGMLWVLLTLRLAHRLIETDSARARIGYKAAGHGEGED